MISVDLQNAFDPSPDRIVNNFGVLLLRLIAKADSENRAKLQVVFPVEVKAEEIYKHDCPYVCRGGDVDWVKIEDLAWKD